MTEKEKLMKRLFGDKTKKLLNFNVFWGPDAHKLSVEERCKALNDMFDEVAKGNCKSSPDFGDSNLPTFNVLELEKKRLNK